jgi:hypothetical protein
VADEPQVPQKVREQLAKAGLPTSGQFPFRPRLTKNRRGDLIVLRAEPRRAPSAQAEKSGWVDVDGRIWVRDHAHAGLPPHWDVQEDDGATCFRVDYDGNVLP